MKTRLNNAHAASIAIGLGLAMAASSVADGLPGKYLLSYRWRDLLTRYSPAANPAVITDADYVSVRLVAATLMQTSFGMGGGRNRTDRSAPVDRRIGAGRARR